MLSLAIVGLPNVGKSSLFNALTAAKADAANYPFCTVEPNVGIVEVPDPRLARIAAVMDPPPRRTVPATVQFVDIAGLVKGASQGEGLGTKFLSHIRETDAVVQVVRCFDDPDVTHVMGSVDPVRDREVIEFELALADLASVERRLDRVQRSARSGEKEVQIELPVLERARAVLNDAKALWEAQPSREDLAILRPLQLLTDKPVLYAANVTDHELHGDEGPHLQSLRSAVAASGEHAEIVPFSARIEAELAELSSDERAELVHSLGVDSAGLERLIHAGYHLLGLRTFFTAGEQELRALDDPRRRYGARRGRNDSQRLSARLYSRRNREHAGLRGVRRLEGGPRKGRGSQRRQGVLRAGWRRNALPVQCLTASPRTDADNRANNVKLVLVYT